MNGVAELVTDQSPVDVIQVLLELENQFGRVRTIQNAPRILDLDLLTYNDQIITGETPTDLTVPHPRMCGRSFVLYPLRDIAPDWCDPISGQSITDLVNELPEDQVAHKMENADGLYGTEWKATPIT